MSAKLVLFVYLSVLVAAAMGRQQSPQLSQAQQCRLQRLTASQPSQRLESEGGLTELWDENEEQFQCAGVAPMRNILQPNSLSLPNFHPSPRLVYIEKGEGLLGMNLPGCAETFNSQQSTSQQEQEHERGSRRDQHHKVHRIRQGDVVALPAGVSHWTFNDGNEELVAVSINDLNNPDNQLDQKFRAFYLAGEPRRKGQQSEQSRQTFQNIFRSFDAELMAEAFNVPVQVVRKMQEQDERGLIVKAKQGMRVIRPDEEQQERGYMHNDGANGVEETICSLKIRTNLDNRRQADVYSRQAGKLNVVNQDKLPILRYLDLSASKGNLYPNALFTPHWSMNGHNVIYVTRGDAQMQIVGQNGQTLMNDRVEQGSMFVIPQYFAATAKAGRNGFEWVAFKTTKSPMRSPLAGYTSVFRAMPLEVITNSYQVSKNEAQNLKLNRGGQSLLLSPQRGSSY